MGGFGSAVLEMLSEERISGLRVRRLGIPDRFIEHGTQEELRRLLQLDAAGITAAATDLLQRGKPGPL
jgi:1-deoxy-D-xylulose-5-phosphate synthase